MAIKAIIFDYDGVLVDSFHELYLTYLRVFKAMNFSYEKSYDEFVKDYGKSFHEFYDNIGFDEVTRHKAASIFSQEVEDYKPQLFDGIKKILPLLEKQYKLFLVTRNKVSVADKTLEREQLSSLFTQTLGWNGDPEDEAHKDLMFKKILDEHSYACDEVVCIGDRQCDYHFAKKAGIVHNWLVEYGWGYDKQDVVGYDLGFLIEKPEDILTMLEKIGE